MGLNVRVSIELRENQLRDKNEKGSVGCGSLVGLS